VVTGTHKHGDRRTNTDKERKIASFTLIDP
jgi:hypothetical protein